MTRDKDVGVLRESNLNKVPFGSESTSALWCILSKTIFCRKLGEACQAQSVLHGHEYKVQKDPDVVKVLAVGFRQKCPRCEPVHPLRDFDVCDHF